MRLQNGSKVLIVIAAHDFFAAGALKMIQGYLCLVLLLSTEPPYQTLVVQDVGTIAQLDASSH